MVGLFSIPFSNSEYERIRDFDCGHEPWSREASQYIKGRLKGDNVFKAISKGVQVWLFLSEDDAVVGFGSLSIAEWRYPEDSKKFVRLPFIPRLAIDRRFQHKPDDVLPNDRYSSKIMDFLATEACHSYTIDVPQPVLGLCVNRDNVKAIRLYERCGFAHYPFRRSDYENERETCRMLTSLAHIPLSPNPISLNET